MRRGEEREREGGCVRMWCVEWRRPSLGDPEIGFGVCPRVNCPSSNAFSSPAEAHLISNELLLTGPEVCARSWALLVLCESSRSKCPRVAYDGLYVERNSLPLAIL